MSSEALQVPTEPPDYTSQQGHDSTTTSPSTGPGIMTALAAHSRRTTSSSYRSSVDPLSATSSQTAFSESGHSTLKGPRPLQAANRYPTNYISLCRKSTPHKRLFSRKHTSASIKGLYTLNPFLHVPRDLLSPVPEEGAPQRKNLKFEVENGGIDTELILIGDPPADGMDDVRTTLELTLRGQGHNTFPLKAKIHTPNECRPPFHLSATALDGYVSLHLPASFHGAISITVATTQDLDAHISISHALKVSSIILSETAITRTFFVGELGGYTSDDQQWKGDKVEVVVNSGRVRLQLIGETDWDALRKLTWKVK